MKKDTKEPSRRVKNILTSLGYTTKEEVAKAYADGKITWRIKGIAGGAMREIKQWVGPIGPYDWMDGLSVRTKNCLTNHNFTSRQQVLDAYHLGTIASAKKNWRNFGHHSYVDLLKFLGVPEPKEPTHVVYKKCPHCGHKLND